MAKGKKRSFDQHEEVSLDYVLSTNDHCNLEKMMNQRRPFPPDKLTKSMKIAALKASSYVVPLISFSGDEVLSVGCGTIFETEENSNVVMTSLNLIRRPAKNEIGENSLANNLKIVVNSDNNLHVAEICVYDFHYNLLILKFKSKTPLQPAKLELIDLNLEKSTGLSPYGSKTKTKPGDPVIVVGRYFYEPYDLMAVSGTFRKDHCRPDLYDCRELFSTDCLFSECGEGGPLINLSGEVLGMVYYGSGSHPVMPINIIYKWWEHYKIYGEKRHPSYGFEACNFYAARLPTIHRVIEQFPSISSGIVVEEVSFAQSELCEDDVIVKCDDKFVESFSEFWDLMWEKVGQSVKLLVARSGAPSLQSICIPVFEATKVNNWPWFGSCDEV